MKIRKVGRRGHISFVMVMAVLAALAVALPGFAAAGISGQFESDDGNLANSGDTDWNDLVSAPGIPITRSATGSALEYEVVADAEVSNTDVVYKPGSEHDLECPALTTKREQNKSDFTRFGIANEKSGTDTFVYLYWVRTAQNSTSASGHASFELNQGEVPCAGSTNEAKNVVRTAGDVLFVYDFEGGPGQIPTINAYRWIDGDGNGANGASGLSSSDCETGKSLPCWGMASGDLVTAGHADARVNDASIGPVFDVITNGNLQTVTFGEAAINFDAAGIFSADDCLGFGQARVSSRASGNSFSASLKDWVEPASVSITNCGSVLAHKVDADDTSTLLPGATFRLSPSELDANAADSFEMDEIADGVFCADALFPGTYWIHETVAPDEYELDPNNPQSVAVTADGTTCGDHRLADAPDVRFENERLRGSILVHKVDENGDALDGASFEYALGMSTDDPETLEWQSLPATVNTGQFCVDQLAFDDYVVRETGAPAGYDAILDLADVTVDDKSECDDRIGDGLDDPINPADTADATYENSPTPGRVFITKVDDAGTPMAGIEFELWTAKDDGLGVLEPDADTGRSCTTDVLGDCYEGVTLGFQQVDLGSYCIVEGTLPTGYDPDPDLPECFEIELTEGGDEFLLDYENPRQHRIIVLTCHEGTDTLVSSDVTLGSDTASSLDGSGLTEQEQAALCSLGGASFGGLSGHDTHDVEVEFQDH